MPLSNILKQKTVLGLHRMEKSLSRLNSGIFVVALLILEGLIFWFDLNTKPTILIGPYFLFPIVLSAWFLDKRFYAYAFALLSTMLRIYCYRQAFPENGDFATTYNILLTGFVYLVFAELVLRNKRLVARIARHARQTSILARLSNQKMRLAQTIRRALPGDVDSILDIIVTSARQQVFDADMLRVERQQQMHTVITNALIEGKGLRDKWEGGQAMVLMEYWVSEVNGKIVGYIMVLGMNESEPFSRELHSIVVTDQYRGLGIGTILMDFFCRHYRGQRLILAGKPGTQIIGMAERRGFAQFAHNNVYILMEKRDSASAVEKAGKQPVAINFQEATAH